MTDIIEGFKIDLTSEELVSHLRGKAIDHAEKHGAYTKQAAGVADLQEPSGTSNDPVSSLRNSARTHAARATYFTLLADHVIPKVVYRLSEVDLERLEFYSRYG